MISEARQFKYYSKQHSSKTVAKMISEARQFKYYSKQHSSKTGNVAPTLGGVV